MSGRFNGDDDDDYNEQTAEEYFRDEFNQLDDIDFDPDFRWSEIDAFDLDTAREIMENIFDSGYYPDVDTLERLEDLTGLDYDFWEYLWDYYDGELDLDRYSED